MQVIKKNILVVIFSILIIFAISFGLLFSTVKVDKSNQIDLDTGWSISINDQHYEDVNLRNFLFTSPSRGDSITMSCTFPDDATIHNPMLVTYTVHCDIEVYYNGDLIYSYGQKLRENNEFLGYGYHFISIPEDYASADIEIVMNLSEDDTFSSFNIPLISNSTTYYRNYLLQHQFPMATNMFLIIFGVLIVFLSICFCFVDRKFFKLVCVGFFSLGIGCWSLCNYDLIALFTDNLRVKAYMEFSSLYIAPLFVLLYFWKDEFVTRNRCVENMYKILLISQGVFTLSAFILQATNTVHLPAVLKIQHLLLLLLCLGFIALTICDIVKKQFTHKTLILGMTSLIIVGMFDLLRFTVLKYEFAAGEINFTSSLCIGALLFVVSQLIDFGSQITQILLQGAKAEALEQIAYSDALTGVANRHRCEEIWDELDAGSTNYGIYSFDLNFLKKTNDQMGHSMGDTLIQAFSEVLTSVFSAHGTIARIGGDEFLVIIPDLTGIDTNELTKQLDAELAKANENNPNIKLSTAYGFCSHDSFPTYDSRKIYKIADDYMYQHKASMKVSRKP